MRHRVILLFLLAAPAALAEDPAPLIQQLGAQALDKRLQAAARLEAMGDAARVALQNALDPNAKADAPEKPDEQLRQRIAALIAQLGDPRFKLRQEATRKLIKIGRPATGQLRAALKAKDLEVRQRASQILDALYPKVAKGKTNHHKLEVAMLLGRLGTRESIPALRRLLTTGDARESAAAAGALRVITGGGPSDDPARWRKERARLLTAWAQRLDGLSAAAGGPPTTLELGYAKGSRLTAGSKNAFEMRIDLSKLFAKMPGPKPPGMGKEVKLTQKGSARYRVKVIRLEPLAVSWRFTEHESVSEQSGVGGAGAGKVKRKSYKGKDLVLELTKQGKLQLTMDDKPLSKDNKGPMLELGLLVALKLPRGAYRVGQSRALGKPFFDWLVQLIFANSRNPGKIQATSGKLTYLGRTEKGRDRYYLLSRFAHGGVGNQMMRMCLQGPLEIDPARGVLVRYELSGPLDASFGAPAGQQMVADGYWQTSYEVEPEKGKQEKK